MARLDLKVLPTNRSRREVLSAEECELIEVRLSHVFNQAARELGHGVQGTSRRSVGASIATVPGSNDAQLRALCDAPGAARSVDQVRQAQQQQHVQPDD